MVPEGKHYFYFIFDRKHIFLSPNYDIVRFKGTNVFLNAINVKPREGPISHVTLPRPYKKNTGPFNKDRSVFAAF